MDFKNHIPIYLQIIDTIKKDLILGHMKPGDKLDSVRSLATKYKVNPNTVQKAFQEMERSELAYSKRGIGTFIIERDGLKGDLIDELSVKYLGSFAEDMKELGLSRDEIMKRLQSYLKEENI